MIKAALLRTIHLIEDYQNHCPNTYMNVETELNDLKIQMKSVIKLLEDTKEVA